MFLTIQARIQKLRTEENAAKRRMNFAQRTNTFLNKVKSEKDNDKNIKMNHFKELKEKECEDRKRFSTIRNDTKEIIMKGRVDNFMAKKNIGGSMRSER